MVKRSAQMSVCVQVDLTVPARQTHLHEMASAARSMTDDQRSIRVSTISEDPKSMLAGFTMPKARQVDLVDKIMHEFALFMENYSTQSVWFPVKQKT